MNSWNQALGQQTAAFGAHARALAEWDRHIFRNRGVLMAMEAEMAHVSNAQEALVRQLNILEMHQREVHDTLQTIETQLEKLVEADSAAGAGGDGAASERDALFASAEEASDALARMATQLCDAIEAVRARSASARAPAAGAARLSCACLRPAQVNAAEQGNADGANSDPLVAVQRILNNQLSSLVSLDRKAAALSRRATALDA